MLLALLLAQASNFIAVGGGGGIGTDGGAFGFTVGYQRGGQRYHQERERRHHEFRPPRRQ